MGDASIRFAASLLDFTRATVAVTATNPVPPAGNLPVDPAPERHQEGDVQQRHQPPKLGQLFAEIPAGIRPAKTLASSGDHPHLIVELLLRQIGAQSLNALIVQAQVRQFPRVPATQALHLVPTKNALAVPDHHIRSGHLIGIGQFEIDVSAVEHGWFSESWAIDGVAIRQSLPL
jgi:hypothetical protein